jgi:hypothetical protein
MNLRRKILVAVTVLVTTGGIAVAGGAFAADPAPQVVTGVGAPSNYTAVTPVRMLDTRTTVPVSAGGVTRLRIAGQYGLPASGVTAVTVTLTATAPSANGYLTLYPDGVNRPTTSNLNFSRHETVAGSATVAVGANGYLDLYNHAGTTDAVVDLEGYYSADATVVTASAATTAVGGAVPLKQIGGAIRTGITPLTQAVTLQPGTYQVTASGVFHRAAGTGLSTDATVPDTYGTLVIWEDLNGDGLYDGNSTPSENAGTAQTGAIPRMAVATTSTIDASANQTAVITVTQPDTKVYLGGFGDNDDTSDYGTAGAAGAGDFSVVPSMTIQKVNVG